MAMSCFLLHSFEYRGGCGDSRGMTGLFRLGECNDSITTHLNNCHLSRESMTEFELILTRAGVFELPLPKVSEMMICPKHRYSLGKYWKQRRPCQYPMHHGGRKAIKSRDAVNVNMAKEIKKLHGVIVPIGPGLIIVFVFLHCVCLFACLFLLHTEVDLYFSPKKIQCPIFSKFFN